MMNCKEAVRLMSEEMDRELAGGERFVTAFAHPALCRLPQLRRQLSFLRQACRSEVAADDTPPQRHPTRLRGSGRLPPGFRKPGRSAASGADDAAILDV
jgi:hypothetical protein